MEKDLKYKKNPIDPDDKYEVKEKIQKLLNRSVLEKLAGNQITYDFEMVFSKKYKRRKQNV